jgi:hypothetical protein
MEHLLSAERLELTSLSSLDRIHSFDIKASSEGGCRVRHVILGVSDDLLVASSLIEKTHRSHPLDLFEAVCLSDRLEAHDEREKLRRMGGVWNSIALVSNVNSLGLNLLPNDECGSVAGALLLSLHSPSTVSPGGHRFSTFGFSGLYGLAGPSLRRLSLEEAIELLGRQLSPLSENERTNDLPKHCIHFLESYSPKTVGLELFNRAFRTSQASKESISVTGEWSGDSADVFNVSLDRGLIGLDHTPKGLEESWVERLRRLSRTMDMTLAYGWKLRIENTAKRYCEDLHTQLPSEVARLVDNSFRGLPYIELVLERWQELLARPRRPMEEQVDKLEESLTHLDLAVKSRPNPLTLSLRLLLWLVPALLGGSILIQVLYEGVKEVLFVSIFLCVGILLPVSWVIWQLEQATRRVKNARDQVIQEIAIRQETIISENTIGYLNEAILPMMSDVISTQCHDFIRQRRKILEDTAANLAHEGGEVVDQSLTLSPILKEAAHYKSALQKLSIDIDGTLRRAIAEGVFALANSDVAIVATGLRAWCQKDLLNIEAPKKLTCSELFGIRFSESRETSETLLRKMWERAAPLIPFRFAPQVQDEQSFAFAPSDFIPAMTEFKRSNSSHKEVVIQRDDLVLLVCNYRFGMSSLESHGRTEAAS